MADEVTPKPKIIHGGPSESDRGTVQPMSIDDAAISVAEIDKTEDAGEVDQEPPFLDMVLDMSMPVTKAILKLREEVEEFFRKFLRAKGFKLIHTPKMLPCANEGVSAVLQVNYFGKPECLDHPPQLYKQLAVCGDLEHVYEVGPVFRAERSCPQSHPCEFTCLDMEMEIKEHYSELMDMVDGLFVSIFDSINKNSQNQLEAVDKQYPFKPLKYLPKTLRLTFEEGVEMLREAGVDVDPLGCLSTENERSLGELVKLKYDTEFYILHRYPLAGRPFNVMPCYDDPAYSNSFIVFIRGEEVISGAQHIHDAELLEKRARECGFGVDKISTFIDAFKMGCAPHGGFEAGLERLVMMFCDMK